MRWIYFGVGAVGFVILMVVVLEVATRIIERFFAWRNSANAPKQGRQ